MPIKLVSVKKTSRIFVEGEPVTRERVVTLSEGWTERDIILFKKIVKQGGTCKLQGVKFHIVPGEGVTTSKGFRDEGAAPMHGPEE
jgi:ribosomal protein S12